MELRIGTLQRVIRAVVAAVAGVVTGWLLAGSLPL